MTEQDLPDTGVTLNITYELFVPPTPMEDEEPDTQPVKATTDLAGNEQQFTVAQTNDGAAPIITRLFTSKPNGSYSVGEVIDFQVNFSESVAIDFTAGIPTLELNSGGQALGVDDGITKKEWLFRYTVGGGQNSPDLDYNTVFSLVLNGGVIQDVATPTPNNANLELPVAPGQPGSITVNKSIVIDTTPPSIVGITTTQEAGTYGVGVEMIFEVTFTEGVLVSGLPILSLSSGGNAFFEENADVTAAITAAADAPPPPPMSLPLLPPRITQPRMSSQMPLMPLPRPPQRWPPLRRWQRLLV